MNVSFPEGACQERNERPINTFAREAGRQCRSRAAHRKKAVHPSAQTPGLCGSSNQCCGLDVFHEVEGVGRVGELLLQRSLVHAYGVKRGGALRAERHRIAASGDVAFVDTDTKPASSGSGIGDQPDYKLVRKDRGFSTESHVHGAYRKLHGTRLENAIAHGKYAGLQLSPLQTLKRIRTFDARALKQMGRLQLQCSYLPIPETTVGGLRALSTSVNPVVGQLPSGCRRLGPLSPPRRGLRRLAPVR